MEMVFTLILIQENMVNTKMNTKLFTPKTTQFTKIGVDSVVRKTALFLVIGHGTTHYALKG